MIVVPNVIDSATAEETLTQPVETLRLAVEVMTADGNAIDWQLIADALADAGDDLEKFRHILACGSAALTHQFLAGESAGQLVRERAKLVD